MSLGGVIDTLDNPVVTNYTYGVTATGIKRRTIFKEFKTREEAEAYMHKLCAKYKLTVECTERDKHEAKYSNHAGVRFYINRI